MSVQNKTKMCGAVRIEEILLLFYSLGLESPKELSYFVGIKGGVEHTCQRCNVKFEKHCVTVNYRLDSSQVVIGCRRTIHFLGHEVELHAILQNLFIPGPSRVSEIRRCK